MGCIEHLYKGNQDDGIFDDSGQLTASCPVYPQLVLLLLAESPAQEACQQWPEHQKVHPQSVNAGGWLLENRMTRAWRADAAGTLDHC
jgi:hypothetical protein